jgi:DNA-binding XRE family transcriptional regulator
MTRQTITLRELRKDVLGLSQDKFAALLGVSRRTVIRYEVAGNAPAPILRLAGRIAKDKIKESRRVKPPPQPSLPA